MPLHQPVLLKEITRLFQPGPGKIFIDATLGNGGHSLKLLQAGAKVYAFEFDPENIKVVQKRIHHPNLTIINDNFSHINHYFNFKVNGILFDLGLSINQQKAQGRGFSFNDALSLDMRLNPQQQTLTAQKIVNTYSQKELFDLFSKYAQEKNSHLISQLIIKNRPFNNALQLADLVRTNLPRRGKIDPATKVFLALRIAVNDEFSNLQTALELTLDLVKPGGRVVIITFHSSEDRIVKNFIRRHRLTSCLIKPGLEEIKQNPLARSAILRSYTID